MVNTKVAAHDPSDCPSLLKTLTSGCVAAHFADICCGEVRCYDLPSFHAINLVLTQILDGGPMHSLRLDPQGKTLGVALLLKPLNNHTESTEKQRQAI